MNHVSVSPTDGNGPTQGQRKTLTRVGIESTTLGSIPTLLYCCDGSFPLVFKSEISGLSSEPTDKLIRCSYIGKSMFMPRFPVGVLF